MIRACRNMAAPSPAMKRDTSKSTCYRCSNVGHFASDPKCLQYKKPEQQCIFTAQIVDNMSDIDQPDHANALENLDEAAEPEVEEDILDKGQEEPSNPESCPDGSQYEDKEPSYEEYNGYALPSDDEEPIYIWAMHKDEAGATLAPPQFDDVDWQSCRDIIQGGYQSAPWMPHNNWGFTLHDGITYIHGCRVCTRFKEYHLVAMALRDKNKSSAWRICSKYKQDLIRLGWTLVHEGG
jgi:hypothetical protein